MRSVLLTSFVLLLLSLSPVNASTPEPTPTEPDTMWPMCTPPPCPPGGQYVCGQDDGCPGGCGTICLLPTDEPVSEPVTIPEPGTILLFGAGMAGTVSYLAARRRSRGN